MIKIIICDWCGFIHDADVQDYYGNDYCLCCGVDDIEVPENE